MVQRSHAIRSVLMLLGLAAAGCVGVARRGPDPKGTGLLERGRYPEAARTFATAAALSASPAAAADNWLRAAEAHLLAGEPRRALECLGRARPAVGKAPSREGDLFRLLGEAHLEIGSVAPAERYLKKALPALAGPARELALARLAVCAGARGDRELEASYRSRLPSPLPAAVAAVLERGLPAERSAARAESGEAFPERGRRPPALSRAARDREPRGDPEGVRLAVLPRSEWRARPVRSNVEPMGRVEKITVHHTGEPGFWGTSEAEAAAAIRRIQRHHQTARGWADIGYHYVVDRAGRIWQGRPVIYQGAHARGRWNNRGNIGVVVLGDYTQQAMTPAQKLSLRRLLVLLAGYFGVDPGRVYTHSEILAGRTDCPGPEVSRYVAQIRDAMRHGELARR